MLLYSLIGLYFMPWGCFFLHYVDLGSCCVGGFSGPARVGGFSRAGLLIFGRYVMAIVSSYKGAILLCVYLISREHFFFHSLFSTEVDARDITQTMFYVLSPMMLPTNKITIVEHRDRNETGTPQSPFCHRPRALPPQSGCFRMAERTIAL